MIQAIRNVFLNELKKSIKESKLESPHYSRISYQILHIDNSLYYSTYNKHQDTFGLIIFGQICIIVYFSWSTYCWGIPPY